MVFCTFDPETQILFFFFGGGPNFLPVGNLSPRTLPRPAGWGRRSKYTCMLRCPGGGGRRTKYTYARCCPARWGGHRIKYTYTRRSPGGRGAPQQIHLCTSLSGGGQERGSVRGLRFPTGKKFGPPPKKKEFGFLGQKCKKPLQNKGFGPRKQPKNKDSVGFIRFFDSANRKCW